MANDVPKLSKKIISLVAFFFGVGVLCTAVGIGAALPTVAKWILAHPQLVLKTLMASCLLPVAWLLGLPVAQLLNRR